MFYIYVEFLRISHLYHLINTSLTNIVSNQIFFPKFSTFKIYILLKHGDISEDITQILISHKHARRLPIIIILPIIFHYLAKQKICHTFLIKPIHLQLWHKTFFWQKTDKKYLTIMLQNMITNRLSPILVFKKCTKNQG